MLLFCCGGGGGGGGGVGQGGGDGGGVEGRGGGGDGSGGEGGILVIGHPLIRSLIRWNCSLFTCSLSSSALLRSLVRSLVYDKPRAHEIFHSCTIQSIYFISILIF